MSVHAAIAQPRLRCGNSAHGHCCCLLACQFADGILSTLVPREIIVARICFVFATKIQERRQLEPRLNRRWRDQLRYRQHLRLGGVLIESCLGDDAVCGS